MKRALILLIILGVVLGGGAWGWRHFTAPDAAAGADEIYTVAAGPVELALKEMGVVQPRQTVAVKSKVSGKVLEVKVAEGDKVKAGQLVAVVEPDATALLTLSQHRLELRRLKIDMDQKEREWQRQRQLRAGGLNSAQQADTAERDFKNAQNLFLQAKTTLNLLEREANQPLTASAEGSMAPVEMNLYRILAPIEGIVSVVKVKPGELITSGSSGVSQEGALLMEIADQRQLEVMVNINEIDIPRVIPGMKAKVTLAARPGKPIPGTVDRVAVAPITDANKLVVYPVAIKLPERPPELRQGMSASVDLTLETLASVLRIPVLAYLEKEGKLIVKLKNKSGKLEDREITVGLKSDKFVEVRSGLAAGDQIAARYPKEDDGPKNTPGGMRRR